MIFEAKDGAYRGVGGSLRCFRAVPQIMIWDACGFFEVRKGDKKGCS